MARSSSARSPDGYRRTPGRGPHIRSDVIDVYVFRRAAGRGRPIELLQLRRSKTPLKDTWQPIMGHIERRETAIAAAIRELKEEVGLSRADPAFRGMWALEQVHPFYIAAINCIVLSTRFAVEVAPKWQPALNHEHAAHRWVPASRIARAFMWPGQLAAIRELLGLLKGQPDALTHLRIDL